MPAPPPVDPPVAVEPPPVTPSGRPAKRYDLKGISTTVLVLLGLHVVLMVVAMFGSSLAVALNLLLLLVTAAAVITWLYQARTNTDWIGYEHQLPRFWTVAGWFVPLGFLYLPVRVVLDVCWARLPEGRRGVVTTQVLVWWVCWCLAWFTTFRPGNSVITGYGYVLTRILISGDIGSTVLSAAFLVVAGIALAVVVQGVAARDPNRF